MNWQIFGRFSCVYALASCIVLANWTFAQEPTTTVRTDVDNLLTVQKIAVLPFTDNLQGIYARPLEAHLVSLVDQMHRWDYVATNYSGPIHSPEELESSQEKAAAVSANLDADAFFVGRVSKGPNGIQIHLSLFLTKDKKLLSQAILKNYQQFNIEDLKTQTGKLLNEIVQRLPYTGRVLSREINRVTVNLGARDGIQKNQVLNVIQLIKVQRHPKFNFLVSTEKETIGKIRLLKVDETLSFGMVITETEKGAVQKDSKIGALSFVSYSGTESLSIEPTSEDALEKGSDGPIVFGNDARAWRPESPPTFGQVGGRLGLSRFTRNTEVSSVGGLDGSNSFAPNIFLEGEIWITPEWTFWAKLRQGIIAIDNPRSGSTPSELNQSLSHYEAGFGYRFRFGPNVWSPFVEPIFSYFRHRLYIDNSSPEAFTTMEYTGFKFGVRGATPIGDDLKYGVGGNFMMALKAGLNESPVTSGSSSSNSATEFGVFGYQKLGERLKAEVHLDFEMYSSTFDGTGSRAEKASSASLRYTTLSGGLYYMF